MTREKKRKLSILASVIGVVLLIVVVVTSDEFKEKFQAEEEIENVIDIVLTDEDKHVIDHYDSSEGIEIEAIKELWQPVMDSEAGKGYVVDGEEEVDNKTIVYGYKNEPVEEEWNGEMYEIAVYYPWIALFDENGRMAWLYEKNNGHELERIMDIVVKDGVITAFSRNESDKPLSDQIVIMSQYSMEGERISYIETKIYGDAKVAIAGDEAFYVYVDKKILPNNGVFEVKADGTFKEVYECASEEDMERYSVVDMAWREGKLYLSMYSRKIDDYNKVQDELHSDFFSEDEDTVTLIDESGEYNIYLKSNKLDRLKKYYSALLYECDVESGKCTEVARMDNSLGSNVSVGEQNELVWQVERIFTAINYGHFDVVANTDVTEYYYDGNSELIKEEKLDEVRVFIRGYGYQ